MLRGAAWRLSFEGCSGGGNRIGQGEQLGLHDVVKSSAGSQDLLRILQIFAGAGPSHGPAVSSHWDQALTYRNGSVTLGQVAAPRRTDPGTNPSVLRQVWGCSIAVAAQAYLIF